jgi:hypothetical protein
MSKYLKNLVINNKVDFISIQETKYWRKFQRLLVINNIWGDEDCCWSFLPSVGKTKELCLFGGNQFSSFFSLLWAKILWECVFSGGA